MRLPPRILYVDDSATDRELMESAAQRNLGRGGSIICLSAVEEVIRYLIGEGQYSDRNKYPFPSLIITDLSMPGQDGLNLLEFLQHNPSWSVLPRIVVSDSVDDDDVKKAFMLGASAYHSKSARGSFEKLIESILGYWILSEVPPVDITGRLRVTDARGKIGERYPQVEGGDSMERVPDNPT